MARLRLVDKIISMCNHNASSHDACILDVSDGFPYKMKSVVFYKVGHVVRVAINLSKTFLTKKIQDPFVLANKEEDLLEFVSPSSLPCFDEAGEVSNEQVEKMN
mmetsp:Transcript_13952/g.24695  ORF Transcript_13952/g.24695 Transcript_13952/m.24695 type:complete len:104 (+) Transcript_13952:92-403(+)